MSHIILVPGLACDDAVWEHQAEALQAVGTVQIIDHGPLDSIPAMAASLLEQAPPRFALAGHSLGGRVALEVMRRDPRRVERLALLDTGYKPLAAGEVGETERAGRNALIEKARTEGMRAMGLQWVQKMVHPMRLTDAPLINSILEMFERKTPEIFAAQQKALLERPDAGPVLHRIQCPTLVLTGRYDSWSPVAQHEEIAFAIAKSELLIIEDSGHMCTMERPDAVSAALLRWTES